eukprot:363700-Chlamydomonas_euryale.AAC.3
MERASKGRPGQAGAFQAHGRPSKQASKQALLTGAHAASLAYSSSFHPLLARSLPPSLIPSVAPSIARSHPALLSPSGLKLQRMPNMRSRAPTHLSCASPLSAPGPAQLASRPPHVRRALPNFADGVFPADVKQRTFWQGTKNSSKQATFNAGGGTSNGAVGAAES